MSLDKPAESSETESDDGKNQSKEETESGKAKVSKPQEQEGDTKTQFEAFHQEYVSTVYPDVGDNLKLKSDGKGLPVEPDSSTGTLASFRNFETFGDQFLVDRPSETDEQEEAISMVDVQVQQDTSTVPTMTAPTPTPTPVIATVTLQPDKG